MKKNAFLISLGLAIFYILILAIPIEDLLAQAGLSNFRVDRLGELPKTILINVLAVFGIKKFKVFELSGLDKRFKWSYKYLAIIPVYLLLIGMLQLLGMDFSAINSMDILLLLISTMSVGFAEEFVFRGLICSILLKNYIQRKNGILFSILITALVFGVLHLFDFQMANISAEISQLLYAIYFGVFFGATLHRTNRLIPLAIIHGLINFVYSFPDIIESDLAQAETMDIASEIVSAIVSSVLVIPLLIAGFFILRKITKEDILEKIALIKND